MLAPMAGVTDMPFRVLCHEMGCPMAVSEMVSAKGYVLSPKGNRAQRELLAVDEREEGAVALQLFGSEPDIITQAAEELTRDRCWISTWVVRCPRLSETARAAR